MRTPTAQPKSPPEARPGHPSDTYSEGWASVRVRGAFAPEAIEARPSERLRLVFRREETAACSDRVLFPSLGKSIMLPPFEDVSVDLGLLPPGEHEFSCGLGALRGRILVGGQPVPESVQTADTEAASTTDRPVGLVGVIGGLILLGSAAGAVVAVLEVLLIVAGLDLIVTGALGHCPLYRKLGHVPASLKRPA